MDTRRILMKVPITKEQVEDISSKTTDQKRTRICQLQHSLQDIYNFVTEAAAISVYPRKYTTHGNLKDAFSERLSQASSSGLAYIADNLSVVANISADAKPDEVLFDVCLLARGFSPTVLSVVSAADVEKQCVTHYNRTLTRGIIQAIRGFTNEDFSAVYGMIAYAQLDSKEDFQDALFNIKKKTSGLCVSGSLSLSDAKRKNITLALLSAIALTVSVDDSEGRLWLLTPEQFRVLTENIDFRKVTVRTTPSSGGKVLMREIARRLQISGPTLLVMESQEQIQEARSKAICSFMMTKEECMSAVSNKEDIRLQEITNLVTNCPDCIYPLDITGRIWTVLSEPQSAEGRSGETAEKPASKCDNTKSMQETKKECPLDTNDLLRKELDRKNMEIDDLIDENDKLRQIPLQLEREVEELRVENQALKQTEEELSRILDSVSLGELSLDSGHGSDVSGSLASFGSLSSSTSDLRTDRQGATGGHRGAQKLLKRVKKSFTFSQFKRELGTVAEGRRRNTATDPLIPIYMTPEGPLYVLVDRKYRNPISLLCGQHAMDGERVNTEYCHLTEEDQMVNSPPRRCHQHGTQRFKSYIGTCSTLPIPLLTSLSALTPVPPAPQYWETESVVGVMGKQLLSRPVLEVGVVEEDQLLRGVVVYDRPRSWHVVVRRCDKHEGYCAQIWSPEGHIKCVRYISSTTRGSVQTVKYGVVIDTVRGRVGFVDVDQGAVLAKIDADFRQTLYPVFGVCQYPNEWTVQMKLVSGANISMTEDKQKLIYSCLT